MNRTKALVLALFAAYWAIVVVILVTARQVYDQAARLQTDQRPAEIGVLLAGPRCSQCSRPGSSEAGAGPSG